MDVKLPHLGEGADSGTVVNLFVKEGDQVAKDQPILELENEKAIATIPSTTAGTVTRLFVKTGDKIVVGQRILSLEEAASAAPGKSPDEPPASAQSSQPPPEASAENGHAVEPAIAPPAGVEPAAAPSIRKLARDLGIDLSRVRGSERGGRIVLADVRAYIQRLQKSAAQPKAAASPPPAPIPKTASEQIDFSKWGPVSNQPLSPLRQVIG